MRIIIKKIFLVLLFFTLFSSYSFSENKNISNIVIIGNSNISQETILDIAEIKKGSIVNNDILNSIQKKLYSSNFFSKINIDFENNSLKIFVEENPLVDYFIIEGLDNDNYLKDIEKRTILKSNSIYSLSSLNKDILTIKNYFSSIGFFNSDVDYTVKKIENNRVNVFIKIFLNNKFSIKNIYFIGDKKYSSSKLIDVISSRQYSLFRFFSSSAVPSTDKLNYDVFLLKNFYLSEGYYDVQINDASLSILDKENVDVIFSINAGNRYKIDSYLISGDLTFLKSNEIFEINKIIQKYINSYYSNKKTKELNDKLNDYIYSLNIVPDISYSISKKTENSLLLTFNIKENIDKQIIKNITIIGNDLTEERVVRNALFFVEGDVFSENKLNKSKDLIQSLGIFKNVNFNKVSNNPNSVDIEISLVEMPTGEVSTGFGIGSSSANITFNLKENNFLGKGISTNINMTLGTEQIIGSFNYVDPDIANTGKTFKNSIFALKNDYKNIGYNNNIIGDTISLKHEFLEDMYLENGFSVSYDKINVDDGASSVVATQEGNYFTSKFFYSLSQDKRNSKFMPTAGHVVSFGQELAIPPSDIPFISNGVSGTFYKLLSEDYVGTIKYRVKTINSINEKSLKLSDRLYLGQDELRGFAYRQIGPKISGDYIGGNYIFSTTIGTTVPNGIPDSWKAMSNIFIDVANIWGSDIDQTYNSSKIRSSAGVGLTWLSPIGPVSMSYAIPLSKDVNDEIRNFNFNIGSAF